jgi:hypothetical protein
MIHLERYYLSPVFQPCKYFIRRSPRNRVSHSFGTVETRQVGVFLADGLPKPPQRSHVGGDVGFLPDLLSYVANRLKTRFILDMVESFR